MTAALWAPLMCLGFRHPGLLAAMVEAAAAVVILPEGAVVVSRLAVMVAERQMSSSAAQYVQRSIQCGSREWVTRGSEFRIWMVVRSQASLQSCIALSDLLASLHRPAF